MDWNIFGSTISGALIGGLIAGFFALKATQSSFKNQRKTEKENEEKLVQSVLQAIHDELDTIFERYQETIGSHIETLDKDKALLLYYPLISDFFSIYHGNTFVIGRISDNDLRKKIIRTYTLAKGMADSFQMNNELLSKWDYAENLYAETNSDNHKKQAIAHYVSLTKYADSLKESHKNLKSETSSLLRELRKNGVLNEKLN